MSGSRARDGIAAHACSGRAARTLSRSRRAFAVLLALHACWAGAPVAAQFPGELRGQVVDRESGAPVAAAVVELPALDRSALSDATGTFHLRGLEAGRHAVVVRHLGFVAWADEVEVSHGRTTSLRVALVESAVQLEGVVVTASPSGTAAEIRVERTEIERAGARTAGDVVQRAPGVVLREESVGGAQTVSIRGSSADAVLVLLDGVPLNDPVTGVADLSTVPASAIESVTVLAGAQSARYGPRAEAGVVRIETRAPTAGAEARMAVGTLGEWLGAAEGSGRLGGLDMSIGGHLRGIDGAFDHPRVAGVDERIQRRANADLAERGAFAAVRARLGGGELRGRAGAEGLERGLPGRGYAPSTRARQQMDRLRGSLGWRRMRNDLSTSLSLAGVSQRVRYLDPAPPFGLPYDDVTRVRSWEARGEAGRPGSGGVLRNHGLGLEARRQFVDAGALGEQSPRARTDAGAFVHASAGAALGGWDAELAVEGRLDHDGVARRRYANRAAGLRLGGDGVVLHLSNRSGYSPPSLGDQFFREGVAIAPNPDLQAERIPSEWEMGASLTRRLGAADAAGGARVYRGDIRGMIVWLPDFRFVWSPRNTNVNRRGLETWAEVALPASGVRLAGSYSLAAITYDREADDDVQVAYRPRHTGQASVSREHGPWRAAVRALYTGTRYPVPARLNALDPFWTIALDLGREWRIGGTALNTAVHVDRLLDEKDSLIFGFPEPGRRIRLEARLRRAENHSVPGGTS